LLLLLLLLLLLPLQPSTQERVVGAHFFSPAHVMPLLEIVRTQFTSKQVRI
jgi:enoyl-CoA hydratase/3-hydroxyacyl-CoA dehydrogenase